MIFFGKIMSNMREEKKNIYIFSTLRNAIDKFDGFLFVIS